MILRHLPVELVDYGLARKAVIELERKVIATLLGAFR